MHSLSTQFTRDDIERHIGRRLKQQRKALKFSQKSLAKLLGITLQQIHKYEKGIDRIAASRLLEISKILSVPTSFFYEGLEELPPQLQEKDLPILCNELKGRKVNITIAEIELV